MSTQYSLSPIELAVSMKEVNLTAQIFWIRVIHFYMEPLTYSISFILIVEEGSKNIQKLYRERTNK